MLFNGAPPFGGQRDKRLRVIKIIALALLAGILWLGGLLFGNRIGYAEGILAGAASPAVAPSATAVFTVNLPPTSAPIVPTVPSLPQVPLVPSVPLTADANPESPTPTFTLRSPLPTAPAYLDASWQQLPIVPEVSLAMKAVYTRGQALGNNPHAFSKVGDCNTESPFFLTPFDQPEAYRLGPYLELQAVINNFAGSFSRASPAAKSGFGPSAMFDPLWANPTVCSSNEGPLACEYRLHRPSFVLIGLGTHHLPYDQFESQLRAVIEYSLDHGIVPILTTKVDVEGGDRVNAIIVYLAQQYDVPLWNFWRAAQPLYNHGQPDGIHFTWARNYFDSSYSLRNGWPVRNLTALQALQAVWQAVAQSRPERPHFE